MPAAALPTSLKSMDVRDTGLSGLLLVEPNPIRDDRGFFLESFQAERYRENGIGDVFVQYNHSRSRQGVLRGLHFQIKRPQAQIASVHAALDIDEAQHPLRKARRLI